MGDDPCRILLVEDEAAHAELIRRAFAARGERPDLAVAANLTEARAYLAQSRPHLVIADLVLPDGRGTELLSGPGARAAYPLLVMTAHGDETAAVDAMKAGALDYVVKSDVTFADMPRLAERALRQWRDITERKQAEQALVVAGCQWQTTFDAITDPVSLLHGDGTILQCNRTMVDFLGQPRDRILGRPCWEVMHGTSAPIDGCPFVRMHESLQREQLDLAASGRWFAVTLDPITDDAGRLVGAVHVMVDITERKQAEQAVRESEEKFRDLFESAYDINLLVGSQGEVIDINPRAETLTGYTREELLRANVFTDLVVPEDRPGVEEVVRSLMRGEERLHNVRWRAKDGSVIAFEVSSTPRFSQDGNFLSTRCILRDLTDRRRAEEELGRYQDRLHALTSELSRTEERERRRIAAFLHDNITHSLATARLRLATLRAAAPSADLAHSLGEVENVITGAVKDARSLTVDLVPPVLYELGFGPALEWLADKYRQEHGIGCTYEDDGRPKPLDDDARVVLFRAVQELLTNVAKYAQAKTVGVSARLADGGDLTICVEDDGVGFDPAGIHHDTGGGFGLFNIRERLRDLGGRLEVDSTPGRGTRATLLVPLRPDDGTA